MTKKLLNGKRIAVLAVIAAIALALSVFALPQYSVETGAENEEIFLEERQTIAVDWNIDAGDGEQDETAHHMGEAFLVEFIFQYKYSKVDMDPDALRNISLEPFKVVRGSEPRISERKITDEVHEMRYSAFVRFVEVNPGASYNMRESEVEYTAVRGGAKRSIDATPPHIFQVSTYCGATPQTCQFRVLQETLEDNVPLFALVLQVAGGISLLAPLALVIFWVRRREGRMVKDSDSETEELIELYGRYVELPYELIPKESNERMKLLQSISYRMSQNFFDIHPLDLLLEDGDIESTELKDSLKKLQNTLDVRHTREGADVHDVMQATELMRDIFGKEIKKRQKKYKKIVGFISRTKEER